MKAYIKKYWYVLVAFGMGALVFLYQFTMSWFTSRRLAQALHEKDVLVQEKKMGDTDDKVKAAESQKDSITEAVTKVDAALVVLDSANVEAHKNAATDKEVISSIESFADAKKTVKYPDPK